MENNMKFVDNPQPKLVQTQKCMCCGKILPLSNFQKAGSGYRHVCKQCYKTGDGRSIKFQDFTSRELIEELKARGYRGELKKVVEKTVKL